ncbi:DUF4169 family protein [Mesorhizobium sp. PUT5]|uniref:DUF4169 family protein n=1 Tax=Mesorhizobium sp. PUT5 TaxID=3454629 RepID=UPI003FA42635
MAEIVNLRLARKQRQRADKERAADQNRIIHGRPKAEREHDRLVTDKAGRFLDGHRRRDAGKPDDDPE